MSLISKDENIKQSVVYMGYLILKEISLHKDKKVSIYDIASALKKQKLLDNTQMIYSLMFLYSTGIIDFQEPYVYAK